MYVGRGLDRIRVTMGEEWGLPRQWCSMVVYGCAVTVLTITAELATTGSHVPEARAVSAGCGCGWPAGGGQGWVRVGPHRKEFYFGSVLSIAPHTSILTGYRLQIS